MPTHVHRRGPGVPFTLLVVGCGDIGLRVLRLLAGRIRVRVLTSTPARAALLRQSGALPLYGNLDDPPSLRRLAGLADAVLHLAPPPAHGPHEPRVDALLHALARRPRGRRMVYASTSGVYGDCGGDWVDESRTPAPANDRSRRRMAAEAALRQRGRQRPGRVASAWSISVLRIPGIYALDRADGDPRARLARGLPVLRPADDVYTNHIHADDLARACVAALFRGRPQRCVNVVDDSAMKSGDHADWVAELCGLPRPVRVTRAEAAQQLSPMALGFLSESRRLRNRRMKQELRVRLHYPTVADAL